MGLFLIDPFRSRGQQLCRFLGTKRLLLEKSFQSPQDFLGTLTWLLFHCFVTPIWPPWRHVKTIYRSCLLWLLWGKISHSFRSPLFLWSLSADQFCFSNCVGTLAFVSITTSYVGVMLFLLRPSSFSNCVGNRPSFWSSIFDVLRASTHVQWLAHALCYLMGSPSLRSCDRIMLET